MNSAFDLTRDFASRGQFKNRVELIVTNHDYIKKPHAAALIEIADRRLLFICSHLFRHLCCTTYGVATDPPLFGIAMAISDVEILGVGSLRAQSRCRG